MGDGRLGTTVAVALALVASFLGAGCGSTVARGHSIVVEVNGAPDLNSANGEPQHVEVHAVALRTRPGDLARMDPKVLGGTGTLFGGQGHWVWPGQSARELGTVPVLDDDQYAFVGIRVAYPTAKAAVVALDGRQRPGYRFADKVHRVTFTLGKDSVTVGGAAPAKP